MKAVVLIRTGFYRDRWAVVLIRTGFTEQIREYMWTMQIVKGDIYGAETVHGGFFSILIE